jgi:hypothetical protein
MQQFATTEQGGGELLVQHASFPPMEIPVGAVAVGPDMYPTMRSRDTVPPGTSHSVDVDSAEDDSDSDTEKEEEDEEDVVIQAEVMPEPATAPAQPPATNSTPPTSRSRTC